MSCRVQNAISGERNLSSALHLYTDACGKGLECYQPFGDHFLSLFANEGSYTSYTQQVFDKMLMWNEGSWNLLITRYAKAGNSKMALLVYHKMRESCLYPSDFAFVLLLQVCKPLKDIQTVVKIHTDIIANGGHELLVKNCFLASTLLDIYAKCGSLLKAQEVFDQIPRRDVISWNALIGGYNKHRLGYEALNYFGRMKLECISPNLVTLLCIVQACCSIGSIDKGHIVHVEIAEKCMEDELLIGSTLVDMYAKCSFLKEAQHIFNKMPIRSTISWNTLISGYSKQGPCEEAFKCFYQMQLECILPDVVTYTYTLNACASIGHGSMGQFLHAAIVNNGFLERDALGNALIDMYVKCGLFERANNVFDDLPIHDTISWNAFLAGYINQGLSSEEIPYFLDLMQWEGVCPDTLTYVYGLKACVHLGTTQTGRALHIEVVTKGIEEEQHVGNALIDMYAKCSLLYEAQNIFERLPDHNIVSWTALIGGYTELGCGEEALKLFDEMQLEGIYPNNVTFICGLKACGDLGAACKGQAIHAEVSRNGLLEKDVVVSSILVDMYARCGMLANAEETLHILQIRDVIAWNAIISGCVQLGHHEKALLYLQKMQLKGISPDSTTYVCCLKAAYLTNDTNKGLEIHVEISRNGLFERDSLVCNALIIMYAEFGFLPKAQEVFDKLIRDRDMVSWTSIICVYAKHGYCEEALKRLKQMQLEGFSPNVATFLSSLKACCTIGASLEGFQMHSQIMKLGFEKDLQIGSMLVTMYVTCGMNLFEAQNVFDNLESRDLVSWNALIASYVQVGDKECVFGILERMKDDGRNPDSVTLISILNACSQGGLVEKGKIYYDSMCKDYKMDPSFQHQGCMIDLFGRAGQLEKAVGMYLEPNLVFSNTLLSACRTWGNLNLGKHVFTYATHLNQ